MADPSSSDSATPAPGLPTMGDSERMSMSDYQTLAHLLRKAGKEDRLGEVMHFVGLEKDVQAYVNKCHDKLVGRSTYLDPPQAGQPSQQPMPTPKAKAKSVAQKGQALLASMAMSSTGPWVAMGSTPSVAVGNVPNPFRSSVATFLGRAIQRFNRWTSDWMDDGCYCPFSCCRCTSVWTYGWINDDVPSTFGCSCA